MPEIQYPKNPNSDTAFVVQEDGTKNRALMTAPQDTSTLELPKNANSCKGYVTVDGKKQRVILTADIGGGGDKHNLGYYATQAALEEAHPTAEAGDWAIVGATDTVWIWDSDNSEWVDSDQKGQVTSVNGQTGAVTVSEVPSQTGYSGRVLGTDGFVAGWVVPEKVQRSTMPQASSEEVGNIYQFVGTTDANYTNGYFYQCVSDGQDPATYSWTRVDVQPAGATYTAGSGISIDANNEISVTDPVLVNNATGSNSAGILSRNIIATDTVAVGTGQGTVSGNDSVALGAGAAAQSLGVVAVGKASNAVGNNSIAVGKYAGTTATGAIQISSKGSPIGASNSDANTFKVANANGNYEIMSADGTVPTDRFTTTPSADGTYVPTLTISSGVATRSWAAPSGGMSSISVTLQGGAANWPSDTQTVTATGVTASNTVIVGAAPASASEYSTSGVICTAQGTDSLTFTCTSTPTNDLTVTVLILA